MQRAGGNIQGEPYTHSQPRAVRPRDEVLAREAAGALSGRAESCLVLVSASSPKAEPAPLAVVMLWSGAGHPQESALCLRKVSLLTFKVLNLSKEKWQVAISSFCIFWKALTLFFALNILSSVLSASGLWRLIFAGWSYAL